MSKKLSRLRFLRVAANACIYATKNKNMKATALGIWYKQFPNNYVIDPLGNVVEPKVYKGNRVIIRNRKQVSVSNLPLLDFKSAMYFKEVFCNQTNKN